MPDAPDPPARAPGPLRRAVGSLRRLVARLLARLHRWAESGWSGPAVLTFNTLQSSFLPAPADTLLLPLGLADPPRVWRLVAWATLGATLGGMALFAAGGAAFDTLGAPVLRTLGLAPADWEWTRPYFERYGAGFVAASAFLPVSTKLSCLAAGAFGVPPLPMLAGLSAGRLARFSVLALAIRFGGTRLRRWAGLGDDDGLPVDAPPEPT